MEEIWKIIEDYPNYEISNMGNCRKINGKVLKPQKEHRGYLRVGLSARGYRKRVSVHRLVGKAFIPNPENKPQINHIDNNKQNNIVTNLEWCTPSENIRYEVARGVRKKSQGTIKVLCVDLNMEFKSISAAARYFNLHKSTVEAVIRNKLKSAAGHQFVVLED